VFPKDFFELRDEVLAKLKQTLVGWEGHCEIASELQPSGAKFVEAQAAGHSNDDQASAVRLKLRVDIRFRTNGK